MNQHRSTCQANPKPNVSVWEMQPDSFLGEGGLQQSLLSIAVIQLSGAARGFGILRCRVCEEREKLMVGINSCPSMEELHLPVPHQVRSRDVAAKEHFLSSRNFQEGSTWPLLLAPGSALQLECPGTALPPSWCPSSGWWPGQGFTTSTGEVRAAQQLSGLF